MDNLKVYNQDGNATGEVQTPGFLSIPWNLELIHQAYKSVVANRTKPVAHTKTRDEVRGGGIKPWRQKGTGRARHGSIRSPIWTGGGVTFGPRNTTDFSQKISKKMLKKALASALAKKASLNEIKITSGLSVPNSKTKELKQIVSNLAGDNSALIVVSGADKNIFRAARNIKNIKALEAKNLNLYDVLNHKFILIEQGVIKYLNI